MAALFALSFVVSEIVGALCIVMHWGRECGGIESWSVRGLIGLSDSDCGGSMRREDEVELVEGVGKAKRWRLPGLLEASLVEVDGAERRFDAARLRARRLERRVVALACIAVALRRMWLKTLMLVVRLREWLVLLMG
jgi:hypothetical protein